MQVPRSPVPPRAEALRLDLQAGKLDGLDFLSLSGCALQQTVAKRNSSLGRIAPPSQRLLLELAFLREAPDCIDTLRKARKDTLALTIEESLALKQQQLPALVFNATLGNREYRDFWRARETPDDYPRQTSTLVVTALEQITADANRWLAGDYQADEQRFELALAEVARGDGGELLTALARQGAYLAAGNRLIMDSAAQRPLCTKTLRSPAAPVLRTVVSKFFIERVQARGAALSQRYYLLEKPIAELESVLGPALPEAYGHWQAERTKALERGLDASAGHVRALQSLLGSCYAEFAPRPTERKDQSTTPANRVPDHEA